MTEAEYLLALEAIERQMAQDYLAEAATHSRNTTLAEVVTRIEAGNQIAARNVFGGKYGKLAEEIRSKYLAGGNAVTETMLRVESEMQRPSAQAGTMNLQTSAVQVEISQEWKEIDISAPRLARNLLGMAGSNSERTGGVVGLTWQDAQMLSNARKQLASGDPVQMRDYLDRERRDRRFDGIIKRAIEAGKPVAMPDIDKITQRYAMRLLDARADTVASVQALEAYNAARNQFYLQLIENGTDPSKITKRWKTRGDELVRASHAVMNGQTVAGSAPFVTPDGVLMMNPGDSSLGAGMNEIENCRCEAVYSIAD